MRLDNEKQREFLLSLLRQVPISVEDKNGRPVTQITIGNLEDGPPADVKELIAAIKAADIADALDDL